MEYVITFDFGTTAIKGAVVDRTGEVVLEKSIDITTLISGGFIEQSPNEWITVFSTIISEFVSVFETANFLGIAMSGQMQDVIPVDINADCIGNAILYSDGRSPNEAVVLRESVGEEYIDNVTGNVCQTTLIAPKISWIKRNDPQRYKNTYKFLFSPKDVIIAKLTGIFCSDTTTCSTAGAMNIHDKKWDLSILSALGIDESKMPTILSPLDIAGHITDAASEEFHLPAGIPVFAGIGDAGASFFASGLTDEHVLGITLGTTGMIGCVTGDTIVPSEGVWNLAAMLPDTYINTVPFLNAGNVHKWICSLISDNDKPAYEFANKLLERENTESGLLFLPYMVGERFPVVDPNSKGCFIGITPQTTKTDMLYSCLEGVCYSIKQGLDFLGFEPDSFIVMGGGARVTAWCQMLADIMEHEVITLEHSDTLTSASLAAVVLCHFGFAESLPDFIREMHSKCKKTIYNPSGKNDEYYRNQYKRYTKIYPAVKELF